MDAAVAIGGFDGVHLGHQAVLAETRRRANERRLLSIAFTFDVPPRCLASPDGDVPRPRCTLSSAMLKTALLGRTVQRIVSVPFSAVRDLEPERFILDVLVAELHATVVVVGDGFRFGAARAGDVDEIRRVLPTGNVTSVASVLRNGEPISSSRIRTDLRQGRIEEATALLGRFPVVAGPAAHGDGIGQRLGAPTINLRLPEDTLIPADGIYASWCFADGRGSPAALYVGSRPTYQQPERRFEVHLLGAVPSRFSPSFAEVHIVSCIRPDHRFSSEARLRRQIRADLAEIERRFGDHFSPPELVLG